ncbi:MAG TPA: Gfo/Idh/MocA family oxidoreductase [Ktedonobacterales bacterium]|nr:Gfo/Idh/MocA family oxidoreductase [Ktedonobacterales bacterium]
MPVKVGMVGAGSMGSNHLRVLSDFDAKRAQLVGIAEPVQAVREKAVNRFHVAAFEQYQQMIEETKPDLVVVAVPTNLHFEVANYALDTGHHVLVEKPIATTLEEAETLIQLAKRRSVHLAVGHVERFNPAVMALKQLLAQGDLGTIFSLHARRLGPFPPRIRDVGVTLDLATHDLDAMRYLTGEEVAHVYAETQQRVHQTHEDLLLGMVRFVNGALGVLDVNWLTPSKVRELTVTGERGMYLVNYLSQDLYFYENDYSPTSWDALRSITGVSEGTMTRLKVQKSEPLRLEYEDILTAIEQDSQPTVTGEDGLAVLRLAHQLLSAMHAGKVIQCMVPIR